MIPQVGVIDHRLQKLTRHKVDKIGLSAFERRHPHRQLPHATRNHGFHVRHLAPIVGERLKFHLNTRLLAHKFIGAGSNGCLVKLLVALGIGRTQREIVILGNDDACSARRCGVVQQKIEKGLLEVKLDRAVVDNFHTLRTLMHIRRVHAVIIFVGKLYILRGNRLAIVEFDARAQPDGRGFVVRAHVVGIGQRVAVEILGIGLDHIVVQLPQQLVGHPGRNFLRVQPLRGQTDMHANGDLAFRRA